MQKHIKNKSDQIISENKLKDSKVTILIGRLATIISILMYVSYISQIYNNLHGQYGNSLQPFVATINCIFWCIYAVAKKYKDWPVFIANLPGVVFAFIAFITSLH